MRAFLALMIGMISISSALGQSGYYPAGAREAALSGAGVTLADAYSLFHNPAGLSQLEGRQAMASYRYRPGWEGMQVAAMAYAGRWRNLGWSAGGWRFGDALYNETWVGLGVGYQMGLTALGLKMSWLQYHIEGFGTRHLPLLEAGGWTEITEQWRVGGHVSNLLLAKLSAETGERMPVVMNLGLAYQPMPQVQLLAQVQQSLPGALRASLAVEYQIIAPLWLRAGLQPTHRTFSGGLGYCWRSWQVDYATISHHPAGWSHQLSIAYAWSAEASQ